MSVKVNVERFCILAAKVGGHRKEVCPQCKALRALSIELHAATIDSICNRIGAVPEETVLKPARLVEMLQELKRDETELN